MGLVPLALSLRTHELRANETLVYALKGRLAACSSRCLSTRYRQLEDAIKDGSALDEDPIQWRRKARKETVTRLLPMNGLSISSRR